jgi:hypothetical protein
MIRLHRYSIKGVTILFFGYLVVLSVIRNTMYSQAELPIIISFFSYTFFGFWSGMLFMSFLYRSARKNSKKR